MSGEVVWSGVVADSRKHLLEMLQARIAAAYPDSLPPKAVGMRWDSDPLVINLYFPADGGCWRTLTDDPREFPSDLLITKIGVFL